MKHRFAPVLPLQALPLLLAMLLCAAALPAAAAEDPATRPESAANDDTDPDSDEDASPTTAPGESPKSALKAYNAAMRAGDVEGILVLQHAANETERRVARAIARSEAYVGRMLETARQKFGADGAARIAHAMHDISDAEIDAATQTIQGDRALLRFNRGGSTTMIRSDGEWKASVTEVIRSYGGDPDEAIDQVTRRGNFAKVLAQDIAAGTVKTIDDAIARVERHERGTADHDPAN